MRPDLRLVGVRAKQVARDWKRFTRPRPRYRSVGPGVPTAASNAEFLIGTKRGLFLWNSHGLFLVAPGEFYGLTRRGDHWYAFEKLGSRGRLLRFQLVRGRPQNFCQLTAALSPGCHQIDFFGRTLFVTDTYNNALRSFAPDAQTVVETGLAFPPGPLPQGRESANYAHLNSLWSDGNDTILLFHNETSKTGRASEIAWLDRSLRILECRKVAAENGHNILRYQGEPMYCDSQRGRLMLGTRAVFECDLFTRGLSVTKQCILVGGSSYGKRRAREKLKGAVFFLSPSFSPIHRLSVPGMIQEIRCVNQRDFALSNDARAASGMAEEPPQNAFDLVSA